MVTGLGYGFAESDFNVISYGETLDVLNPLIKVLSFYNVSKLIP